ncbi:MAG: ATP-binding cassette domain-containing protein [Alicyclobacillus sp.]|nr:ATP-binding cassette domain-containing protein [Alicyclobacillus sp.]
MSLMAENVCLIPDGSTDAILRDIHLELPDGQVTLLVGASGAGKSTLLECLAGLTCPTEGTVYLDGEPVLRNGSRSARIAARLGMMFQFPEHQLFAASVAREFHHALRPLRLDRNAVFARRDAALAMFGLTDCVLEQSPLTLSGGQRRRVAMAIGFARQPDWLLLDEPSAGLDAAARDSLLHAIHTHMERVRSAGRGGIVIATHDLDVFLPAADQVVILQAGQIASITTPSELLSKPALLRDTGVGLSERLAAMLTLRQAGLPVPSRPLAADQMAEIIAEAVAAREAASAAPVVVAAEATHAAEVTHATDMADATHALRGLVASVKRGASSAEVKSTHPPAAGGVATPSQQTSLAAKIDARAKIISAAAICMAVFVQTKWFGVISGGVLAAACAWSAQLSPGKLLTSARPLVTLALVSVLMAGLSFHHGAHWWNLGWNWLGMELAVKRMVILLAVLMIGGALSSSTSHLQFQRSLASWLSPLARLHVPVEAFALGSGLVLRFMPVIARETRRCVKAAQAHGRPTRRGRLYMRDVRAIIIPLVLAMLRYGEDVSLALEARGYRMGARRPMMEADGWTRLDFGVTFAALAVSACFWMMR